MFICKMSEHDQQHNMLQKTGDSQWPSVAVLWYNQ
jgi:hypothetical protein